MSVIYLVPTNGGRPDPESAQTINSYDLDDYGRTKCPFHRGSSETVLAVDVDKHGFVCFKPECSKQGIAVEPAEFERLKQKTKFNFEKYNIKSASDALAEKAIDKWINSEPNDIFDKNTPKVIFSEVVREHIYRDEQGKPVHRTIYYKTTDGRKEPRQHKYNDGKWMFEMEGVKRIPYNLSNILSESNIIYVEGEKDCDTLINLGIKNVTTLGSANSKLEQHQHKYFRNKNIIIIPDNDLAGYTFVRKIGKQLFGVAKSVSVCFLPDLEDKHKADITDWFNYNPEILEHLKKFNAVKPKETAGTFWIYLQQYSVPFIKASELFRYDIHLESELVPFSDYVRQYNEFPISIFPPDLQKYIKEMSDAMCVPPDWFAGSILAVSSSFDCTPFLGPL